MFKNISAEMKAGLIPVVPYIGFIIFLSLLMLTNKEGYWALIPLYFITLFPFIFLFELFYAWLTGWQDVSLANFNEFSVKMIIGGILNIVVFFLFLYLLLFVFN